jgi:hypothetical protein
LTPEEATTKGTEGTKGTKNYFTKGNYVNYEPEVVCDVCGSADIVEIKCKVVCRNCGTILKSCSDL